ncbi:crotonobetainyl-CoA:carnitine CoA-transferase CaiB-like acyl-CoA transferase [Ancylobacter aquaticus]|uniref:Crotonobetainyl-CoA:carnitine CoA-transferase CaiB-like acyl-CoA transferase n=1 Tax=Ancylobacter aquaticus TaxID=100 RepID=A0A4R1I2Z6_ANCAQ|nr:CoA transferase [Ancylobacter aquaticus]TCK28341.1 crotonobetainyl-CoA:carnitine CoA-transferase CaiB-like acyl-CoA transferase [Ancylobacter aquaticus]
MNRFTPPPFRGPLADLKVLELGSDISVAFGARLLADLGAEVVKVEPPEGDALRGQGPFTPGGESALFAYLNCGKTLVSLDGETAGGWHLLGELAGRSDLVIATDRALRGAAPDWVQRPATLVVSAQGLSGPGTGRPSSSFIQQHASGFAFHQASPVTDPEATPPVGCADWEGDMAGGLVVAIAALWAVEAADGARPGPLVDLSHEDLLVYMLVEPFADWQAGMDVTNRRRDPSKGLTIAGGLVWYLPCADGAVMVSPREDHQWARWCEVMGHPGWTRDASLCGDRVVRTGNAARLQELMAQWSTTQRNRDVVEAAKQARVACFPVSTPRDLIENVQLRARQFFNDVRFADGTALPMPALPFRFVSQSGDELARGGEMAAPARTGGGQALLAALLAESGMTAKRSAVGGL